MPREAPRHVVMKAVKCREHLGRYDPRFTTIKKYRFHYCLVDHTTNQGVGALSLAELLAVAGQRQRQMQVVRRGQAQKPLQVWPSGHCSSP